MLPTRLPLPEFYEEPVKTQQVLNMKHLACEAPKETAKVVAGHLLRGQMTFLKMLWKFNSVYNRTGNSPTTGYRSSKRWP
ncbi:MAG: hypothetical protein ACREII_08825 [Nitrospiraceae bacterium]